MSVVRIDAADDPRIADYVQTADPDLLRLKGLFVAEGRLVVERIVEHGGFAVRSLLLSDAAHRALSGSTTARLAPAVPVYICPAGMFEEITGHNIHRGCLALVERPTAATVDAVIEGARLVVALENVANADNVGGVFRNAAAFGADAIVLSPSTCDPLYRKAIRTSMAATLTVRYARATDWPADLTRLKARGFSLVALTPREPAEALDAFAARVQPRFPPERLVLIAGAEGAGISGETMALADFRVRIPMRAEVDSLNLAVATGIALSRLSGPPSSL